MKKKIKMTTKCRIEVEGRKKNLKTNRGSDRKIRRQDILATAWMKLGMTEAKADENSEIRYVKFTMQKNRNI